MVWPVVSKPPVKKTPISAAMRSSGRGAPTQTEKPPHSILSIHKESGTSVVLWAVKAEQSPVAS